MIQFMFQKDIEKEIKNNTIKYQDDLIDVKGLALTNGEILINLSADQWKLLKDYEDNLIIELSKTIIHENMHLLIEGKYDDEERICQIMADQIGTEIVPEQKRNI